MYQSDSELVAPHPVLKDPSCSPMLFRQDGVLAFYCLHCWVKRWQFTFCIFRKKKSMGGFPFRSIDQAAFLNGLSRGSRAKPLPKGAWIMSFAKLLGLAGNSSGSLFSLYIVNCTEEQHHSNIAADEVCRQIWANFDNKGLAKCRHLGDVCKKHLLSHHHGICGYLSLADVYQSGKHLPNWENICLLLISEAGKIIGMA